MELNAEINKVFGQEMAKLFSEKISEETINSMAQQAWANVTSKAKGSYFASENKSQIEKEVEKDLTKRFAEEFAKFMNSAENRLFVEEESEKIFKEVRRTARDKIVEYLSNRIADTVCNVSWRDDQLFQYVDRKIYEHESKGELR